MTHPTPTRDEAVLTGWKLVPVEPTEAMMAIGRTCGTNSANTYAAMLASAPAPASGGVDAVNEGWMKLVTLLRERAAKLWHSDGDLLRQAANVIVKQRQALVSLSPAATPVSEAEGEADMRRVCEALGFDPTNHHNAAKCPYCTPALAKPASSPAGGVRDAAIEMLSHLKLYVLEKLEPADADMLHDRMHDLTTALSQSTSGGRVGG